MALLALSVLAVVGSWVLLQTGAGGRLVRDQVVARLDRSLLGTLEVDLVRLRGLRVVLEGVRLYDPDGELVAAIDRVEAVLSPLQLFRRTVAIDSLTLTGADLHLVQDEEGLNLQRALEPREPRAEEEPGEGGLPFDLLVRSLRLVDGHLTFSTRDGPSPMEVEVVGLDLQGELLLQDRGRRLQAELLALGEMNAPAPGPVRVELSASLLGEKWSITSSARLAGSRLEGRVGLEEDDLQVAHLDLLELDPSVAAALVEGWPLLAPLTASGVVERQGQKVRAKVELGAAGARLGARAELDLERRWVEGLHLVGEGIDLARLVEDGPQSDLSFTLEGNGGGDSLRTLQGQVVLSAPASTIGKAPFGPVHLRAQAASGKVVLERLDAVLPGLALTGSGEVDGERVRFLGRVAAHDLATFDATFGKLVRQGGLKLSGSGALAVRLEGPLQRPSLQASGSFLRLGYGDLSARRIRLRARVADASAPLGSDARFALSAASARVGERRLSRPYLSASVTGRRLRVAAGSRGAVRLDLGARGEVAQGGQQLTLSRLWLRSPRGRWALERPAHLVFGEGLLAVDRLALRAGRQRLVLQGRREGQALDARLQVRALSLALLPTDLLQPAVPLGGRLDLDLRAVGTVGAPQLTVKAAIRQGRIGEYRPLELRLDAAYREDRLRGQLRASGLGARARLEVDLPVTALGTGAPEALRAELVLQEVALGKLSPLRPFPLVGQLSGRAVLEGTAMDPRLDAQLSATGLRAAEHPPLDATVRVRSGERGRLFARLEAKANGEESFVLLETPWTLARLWRRPPTPEQAMRAKLALTAQLRNLPIPIRFLAAPTERFARLSGEVHLHGTVLEPGGNANLVAEDLGGGDLWPLRAEVNLVLEQTQSALAAKVTQSERTLFWMDAHLGAPLVDLRRLGALRRAPLRVELQAGPLDLGELQALFPPPRSPDTTPMPPLLGVGRATLELSGTLEAPEVSAEGSIHGLGRGRVEAVGELSARFSHQQGRSRLAADLLSRSGDLALRVSAPLSLSLSALERGHDYRRLPLEASLRAQSFDPSFLSGTIPRLLEVGGRIDAAAELSGPLGLPEVRGRVAWVDGRLALEGYGRYREILLRAGGTEQRVVLEELSARSGRGRGQATAELNRRGEVVDVSASVQLHDFPIVSDFQKVAEVSVRAEAEGQATLERVDLHSLRIPEAQVSLPPTARRELHPLGPAEAVTFYYDGEPLEGTGGAGAAGLGRRERRVRARREVRARVEAPRNLWVRGEDINVELGLIEGFEVVLTERLELFGGVRLVRGQVEVLGRRFELSNTSTATFTGPLPTPRLDVVATHQNRREDVEVTVSVSGQGAELSFEVSSEPPLPETEIYTLLATGRTSLRPGSRTSGAGVAASVVGSLAATQLRRGLEQVLPLDVLTIEPGERGVGGTRVEAGTYVSDRLYLGITSQIGRRPENRESQNQLLVEYQLWRRWLLELEYGDAREGELDLMWRRQY